MCGSACFRVCRFTLLFCTMETSPTIRYNQSQLPGILWQTLNAGIVVLLQGCVMSERVLQLVKQLRHTADALEFAVNSMDPNVRRVMAAETDGPVLVEELNISSKAKLVLSNNGIETIGELVRMSKKELLELRNCGETTVTSIVVGLREQGLELRRHAAFPGD